MAKVTTYADGLNHLSTSVLTTLDTLCGICDDQDNKPESDEFDGEITCKACADTARIVFESCTKSETKKACR
ncbi:hypothetical protein AB0001_004759 [Salmonella enterica]|nr:hypothetical protein [Salmonella enterica]EEP3372991.1 hypothetical protein [Salmonella enterica]EFP6579698.1 hypothetical protein [Salmonella enterica]EGC7970980.1 hypothetical protein [Salmonella enterica]EIV4461163.1 hypothetical protein [Salmonella enterica]